MDADPSGRTLAADPRVGAETCPCCSRRMGGRERWLPRRLQVSLRSALGGEIPEGSMNEASGRQAVREMRGPASTWAHDTGFSERAFFVDRVTARTW